MNVKNLFKTKHIYIITVKKTNLWYFLQLNVKNKN
jgi:hypothetical protein